MFSSMTVQLSPRVTTMVCSCVNAILLVTSLLANTYAAPTMSSERAQFWDIVHTSQDLYSVHHTIYNQFRLQRLQSEDIILETMKIEGFPNFRSLSLSDRIDIGADNLTVTDRDYLTLVLSAMQHVVEDELLYPGAEDTGFIVDFQDIVSHLEVVVNSLNSWVTFKGLEEGTNHLDMNDELDWPNVQEFERTLHALYILQELDRFIPTFRSDFTRLFW